MWRFVGRLMVKLGQRVRWIGGRSGGRGWGVFTEFDDGCVFLFCIVRDQSFGIDCGRGVDL